MSRDRILIADDDPPLRGLISVVVRRHGLEADVVADGTAAIEHLRAREYGVVILDLMMPKQSGYDVIDFIKEMKDRPVVIVVTAMDTGRYLNLASDAVTTVMRKPFDIEMLGVMVAETARGMREAGETVPFVSAEEKAATATEERPN